MYLIIDKNTLVDDLKKNVVEVMFDLPPHWQLPEGQNYRRVMNCTLIPTFFPPSIRHEIDSKMVRESGSKAVYVLDVNSKRIVTLELDRIISAQLRQNY